MCKTENAKLKEYCEHTHITVRDMELDELISQDISNIWHEVGGQDGMYNNFPLSRVYRDKNSIRVYCLTEDGGVAIIQDSHGFKVLTLGEDDGYFFLNSANMYCSYYGNKLGFVFALSEALSLFNNIHHK